MKALTLEQSMERAKKDSRDIQSPRGSNVTLSREGTYTVSNATDAWEQVMHSSHFKSAKCNKCHKTGHITKVYQMRESTKKKKKKSSRNQNH